MRRSVFEAHAPLAGTAICPDPCNMVAYGISCSNKKRKKLKGYMKNNKRK